MLLFLNHHTKALTSIWLQTLFAVKNPVSKKHEINLKNKKFFFLFFSFLTEDVLVLTRIYIYLFLRLLIKRGLVVDVTVMVDWALFFFNTYVLYSHPHTLYHILL